jgi:glucose-1-phosphate cytidylyltransferase
MRVVLFCGGQGMRMREFSESIPKSMVPIGPYPILWHLMRYYAYYGHKEFILCLGYMGNVIKEYFLNYNEYISNDFVLFGHNKEPQLLRNDMQDWKITFVDTGLNSNIGQRLKAVQQHLEGEEMFLANYTDVVCDVPMDDVIEHFNKEEKTACFVAVKPTQTFHVVDLEDGNVVHDITPVSKGQMRINGGFFVLKSDIFDYIRPGEELVLEPFQRLISERQLIAYPYDGFWACMDTFKEKRELEDMYNKGNVPWDMWHQ